MHIYWMLEEKKYLFQRDYVDWGHIKIESATTLDIMYIP